MRERQTVLLKAIIFIDLSYNRFLFIIFMQQHNKIVIFLYTHYFHIGACSYILDL